MNQYETENIKKSFFARAYREAEPGEKADVYVINTCTVTHLSDRKSRQYIRRAHRENPAAVIAVTGCYAQRDREDVQKIEGVNLVVANEEKNKLVDLVERMRTGCRESETEETALAGSVSEQAKEGRDQKIRAYIKVEDGCDRFCSYCVIPYARGRVRSRQPEDIIREARALVKAGKKEIVLSGINTALYGTDDPSLPSLAGLLRALSDLPGSCRIRLSSLEPTVVERKDLAPLLHSNRLCHHLHLSCQSGSDRILRRMKRSYDRRTYLDLVEELRSFDPRYGVTTDIIVGFPGEEEEDVEDTLRLIEEARFLKVHVFPYSPRPGTEAADMKEQIPPLVKAKRASLISQKAEQVSLAFRADCRGEPGLVLVEERTKDGFYTGYTDNYIRVYLPADSAAEGATDRLNRFVRVQLTDIYKDGMKGVIMNG